MERREPETPTPLLRLESVPASLSVTSRGRIQYTQEGGRSSPKPISLGAPDGRPPWGKIPQALHP